ncbi:MAG: hypothetical protein H6R40_507, partial [Gemmatimonadetes bacterium]|nr:hypothetical protein [Gemmatimonadota bacterium]
MGHAAHTELTDQPVAIGEGRLQSLEIVAHRAPGSPAN